MKSFTINDHAVIICNWVKTRTAFKHTATLLVNGREEASTKICYLNRTWERYEFESVISKLLEQSGYVSAEERALLLDKYAGIEHEELNKKFGMIGAVAKMGDIFCDNKKAKNDWKARMLNAGLANAGLTMPDDWEALDEDTKEARLNEVINQLTK